ncbi:MAG: ribonuclease III, partial [Hydrocarboniphaga effusa]|nr:ribonuclease III [Hydrocarboniphaga effusa]
MSERLAQKLGYVFRDSALLSRALTHRSASTVNYERLEYLGDGLLNFVVGEALFRVRQQAEEGDLSRLRASLVCEDSLAAVAEKLQLGEELVLGAGEL